MARDGIIVKSRKGFIGNAADSTGSGYKQRPSILRDWSLPVNPVNSLGQRLIIQLTVNKV